MEIPHMMFYLDTRDSETTGEAILSLGNEPGGNVVAKLPYVTDLDRIRARMFVMLPRAFDEIEGFRTMWYYHGGMQAECPKCKAKVSIPGASDAQVGRLERLRFKLLA